MSYTLSKNEQKLSVESFKISVYGTSNPAILRLQDAWNYCRQIRTCFLRNLASWLNSLNRSIWAIFSWQRTFHFKDLIAIFWGLQTVTVALLANEARFFRFRVCSLQNEVGNPHFLPFLAKVDHYLSARQVSKKSVRGNIWARTSF